MRASQALLVIPMGLIGLAGVIAFVFDYEEVAEWCIVVAFVLFMAAIGEAAYHS